MNHRDMFPAGTKVKVIRSDCDEYIGATGTVVDYDDSDPNESALIGVVFDTPTRNVLRDGFYDDELEAI